METAEYLIYGGKLPCFYDNTRGNVRDVEKVPRSTNMVGNDEADS